MIMIPGIECMWWNREDGETTVIQSWKEFWVEKSISSLKKYYYRGQNPVIVYGRNKNDYKNTVNNRRSIIKKSGKILQKQNKHHGHGHDDWD